LTERIKLTEDDIAMSPDTHAECCFSEGNYVLVINSKIPTGELFTYPIKLADLKQQILDDQEKAEKWDEFNVKAWHNEYKNENKQLKSDKQLLTGALDLAAKDAHSLKQKLELIKKLVYEYPLSTEEKY